VIVAMIGSAEVEPSIFGKSVRRWTAWEARLPAHSGLDCTSNQGNQDQAHQSVASSHVVSPEEKPQIH
jgi:hypothetical protein